MNIYLKWKQPNEFVQSNLSIFYLVISEKENHFASAKLMIDALAKLYQIPKLIEQIRARAEGFKSGLCE